MWNETAEQQGQLEAWMADEQRKALMEPARL